MKAWINQCNLGDCLEVMRGMPENSVDSIVTDPPYGLSFMGKKWDYDVPSTGIWAECLRVLKPGGHLLAFAGTRTQHRMAVRIEDAGFEIRDMIAWVYGSGFNKVGYIKDGGGQHVRKGWGGSLKPALEPITVARKPLIGTVAANILEHGTGALNIDGCRVGTDGGTAKGTFPKGASNGTYGNGLNGNCEILDLGKGRWPANLILSDDPEVVAAFPQAKGQQGALTGSEPSSKTTNTFGEFAGRAPSEPRGDTGSAARFFYCSKATKEDRNDGCQDIEAKQYSHDGRETPIENAYQRNSSNSSNSSNSHPTVKPTDLMRYLCRLVTPIGGIILDPFMGSGSTGRGAVLEGFRFIGIEREAQYFEIAKARISSAERQGHQPNLFMEAA